MHCATATLGLLAALSLTASAQERTPSADAPVVAPKPGGPDAGHPPLLRADSRLRIFADAQNIHTTATINYTVLRGAVDHVRFAVPNSERLLAVALNGETRPCETATDGDCTTLTVRLPSRTRDSVSLEIHTQRPHSGRQLDLGGESEDQFVRPLGVLQSHGVLLLGCDPSFDLIIEEARGLVETHSSPPADAPHARWRGFRFYAPRLRLQAALLPANPQIHVHQDARYTLCQGELCLEADFTCEAAGSGLFDLRLEVPEAFVVNEVRTDGEPATQRLDERGLALSFTRARRNVQLSLTGRVPWQSAPEQPFPILRPLNAASSTGTVRITAPAGFDVQLTSDALLPLDPGIACTRAWKYEALPGPIQAQVARAQPRLSAHSETHVQIEPDQATITTGLACEVRQTATRLFRFALPQDAESVRIDELDGSARILQRTQTEGDLPGWTIWVLQMNQDVLGTQQFHLTWTVALDRVRGGGQRERRLTLSPPRVLAPSDAATEVLDEASGRITLRAERPLAVSVGALPAGLARASAEDDSLVFHHDNSPAELEINVSTEDQVTTSTLVSEALIEIRPNPDGPADYQCRYDLQSHARRLPIQLPAGAEPLSALFGGAPVPLFPAPDETATADYDAYEIDLSRAESVAAEKRLLVRFRAPFDASALTRRRGSVSAPLPLLGEFGGSSVVIAETRTCLWLPQRLAVVGTPRGFLQADRGAHGDASLAETSEAAVPHIFASNGRPEAIMVACWDRTFTTCLLSGAALLIGVVLLPTTAENRLTMVLLGAVVLALLSLMHPHTVAHGLFAARWGFAAAAVLWAAWAVRARIARSGTASGTNGPVAAVISPAPSAELRLTQLRRGA